MATSLHSSLPIILFLSLLTFVVSFRVDLAHVDSTGSFSKLELFQRTAVRSKHRNPNLTKTRTPVHSSNGEYLLDLAIGTPALKFSAILDTGSDLIWTQCSPCVKCFPQPTPLFHPSQSSTYSTIPCNTPLCAALPKSTCRPECLYAYDYGDDSSSSGELASEKFTFGSETVQLGFGCGTSNLLDTNGETFNASGLVGLGRGPLSLISQLGVGEFSYCFTSFEETKQSPLFIGAEHRTWIVSRILSIFGQAVYPTHMMSTPFTNLLNPTFYYLSLLGISVGGTQLRVPKETFELKEDGSGGVIIDSGTTVTQLEVSAYKMMKREFIHQVKLPIGNASSEGLDLCFSLPAGSKKVELPKLVFHFEDADWEMTKENYIFEDSGLLCLTIIGGSGMSVFGNLQQQNTFIRYDLKNGKLFFTPTQCDRL